MDYSLLVAVHRQEDGEVIEATPTHPSCMGSSQFRLYRGGFPANGEIYFIGIIDCLTYYGAMKKIAHSFKSLLWNNDQLSTVQAQYYADRFLKYVHAIFPAGEQPTVDPFTPRAATNEEGSLTVVLQGIHSILLQNTAPSQNLEEQEFEKQPVHNLAMPSPESGEGITVSIKEYAPAIFARLRLEWQCNAAELASDLLVPILQLQANRISIFSESGTITGISVPSISKKYNIETVAQRDAHTFFAFLPKYVDYMLKNPDSMIVMCEWLEFTAVIVMENPESHQRISFVDCKKTLFVTRRESKAASPRTV